MMHDNKSIYSLCPFVNKTAGFILYRSSILHRIKVPSADKGVYPPCPLKVTVQKGGKMGAKAGVKLAYKSVFAPIFISDVLNSYFQSII